MVAMNNVMSCWFTSGRSTTRSVTKPSATIATIVTGIATQIEKPNFSCSPTVVKRCEEHHGTLREVEHAGRLVDQHEAQGHQGTSRRIAGRR